MTLAAHRRAHAVAPLWERRAPFLLVAWVLLNWGWTCTFGFIDDDFGWVAGADLHGRSDWLHQALLPPSWALIFFRPLVHLSFALTYLAAGRQPFLYHAVNVLLHAGNTLLVRRLALQLGARAPLALLTGLAFAVYPNAARAVAWVCGRTELLCALGYLGAVLSYLRGRTLAALALYALALLAKESAISLPLVILAVHWADVQCARGDWRAAAGFAAVTALYFVVRGLAVGEFAHDIIGLSATQPLARSTLLRLLQEKVLALGQYLLQPLAMHGVLQSAVVLALAFAGVLWWAGRADVQSRRLISFALLWIGLTFLPYAAWARFGPWYLYLPAFGITLLAGTLGASLWYWPESAADTRDGPPAHEPAGTTPLWSPLGKGGRQTFPPYQGGIEGGSVGRNVLVHGLANPATAGADSQGARYLAPRPRRAVISAGIVLWLGASVWRLQINNALERRIGNRALQIVEGVVAAVPRPAPQTVFVITGLERLRLGLDPALNHRGVFVFGLTEALQLRFADRSLGITFEPDRVWRVADTRPIVYLHWDAATETMQLLPGAPPVAP